MSSKPPEWWSPIQASSKPSRSRWTTRSRSRSRATVGLWPTSWNGARKIPKRIAGIVSRASGALGVDPGVEARAGGEARDEGVARPRAGVAHHVPEALGIDHEPGAAVQRHVHLGRRVGEPVGPLVHEDHEAVRVVGEL